MVSLDLQLTRVDEVVGSSILMLQHGSVLCKVIGHNQHVLYDVKLCHNIFLPLTNGRQEILAVGIRTPQMLV